MSTTAFLRAAFPATSRTCTAVRLPVSGALMAACCCR